MAIDTAVLAADLLRVGAAIPVFVYASYRDILERRVKNEVWYPLLAVALLTLAIDFYTLHPPWIAKRVAFNVGIGAPFAYAFYRFGAFGGADMKALVVLALLFPRFPTFPPLPVVGQIPAIIPDRHIFILTILGNTVVAGILYPLSLLVHNAVRRKTGNPFLMLVGKKVDVSELHENYGKVLVEDGDMTFSGTDLDFFRDYVDWMEIESLREMKGKDDLRLEEFVEDTNWISEDIEKDEKEVRGLLEEEEVWITPGIPFIVPMTVGLLLALTVGDILFLVFNTVGAV